MARPLIVLAVLVVASSTALAATPHVFSPPAGWTLAPTQPPAVESLTATSETEIRAYEGPSGAKLLVTVRTDTAPAAEVADYVNDWAEVLRNGMSVRGTEVSYQRTDGNRSIEIHHVVSTGVAPEHSRRLATFDETGRMWTVAATCAGDLAICDPALAAIELAHPRAKPAATDEKHDVRQDGYRKGKIMGSVLLIGLFVWWLVQRKR